MPDVTLSFSCDIIPSRDLRSPPPSARAVYERVRKSDVTVGNFEIPLTRAQTPLRKFLNLRAEPEIAAGAGLLGFDVVTLANNHAVDYGWQGLSDTATALRAEGLKVIGVGPTFEAAAKPEIFTANGRKIGVVAFSCLVPIGMGATAYGPGLAPIHVDVAYEIDANRQIEEPGDKDAVRIRTTVRPEDRDRALEIVRKLAAECDITVVSVHWGFGSDEELADYQWPLGRDFIDAGATIVHGHHPHAVHPIGFYKDKPILFGLGTFIQQQVFLEARDEVKALYKGMSRDGYIAEVVVETNGRVRLSCAPTSLDDDRLPFLATGETYDSIADRLARLSAAYGAKVTRGETGLEVAPA